MKLKKLVLLIPVVSLLLIAQNGVSARASSPGWPNTMKSTKTQGFGVTSKWFPAIYGQGGDEIQSLPCYSVRFPTGIYEGQSADDFVVPAGHVWRIEYLKVMGEFSFGMTSVPSYQVSIYADTNGKPGKLLSSRSSVSNPPDDPDLDLDLGRPLSLQAGRYWLSIQANSIAPYPAAWMWGGYEGEAIGYPSQLRVTGFPGYVGWSQSSNFCDYGTPLLNHNFGIYGVDSVIRAAG